MNYQVLARKYRPQKFEEVVGQAHAVQTLKNAIQTGRIAHAFLFVGPRGIGKTSMARILAKALNAPGGPRIDFDPDQPLCREIAEGRSLDVIEIDGASNNSVDHIRELRDNVAYAPSQGRFKIYIIDEVHMLSASAFNALLKTLEEPPAHVKFIFATTEAHKVLPTILSRCQRFDLRRISEEDIARQLGKIAKLEKLNIESAALRLIARMAEGGMRDAESALEQLINFCGSTIREEDVLQMFGLTSWHEIDQLARAILAGQREETLLHARKLGQQDRDLARAVQDLTRYFRALLLWDISPEVAKEELPIELIEKISSLQPLPTRSFCLNLLEELLQAEARIRSTLIKETVFDILLLRLLEEREKVSLEEILRALTSVEASSPPSSTSSPSTFRQTSLPPTDDSTPNRASDSSPASGSLTSSNRAASSKNPASNQDVSASPSAKPTDQASFLNDPLIQEALKIFEAKIVEVHI